MAVKLQSHIERVLWSQDEILHRVSELASQISADFGAVNSPPPVLVGVATGAFLFFADLVKKIDLPISVDFVRAESYGSDTISTGVPKLSLDLKLDVKGKHVILVLTFVYYILFSSPNSTFIITISNHLLKTLFMKIIQHCKKKKKKINWRCLCVRLRILLIREALCRV